MVVHTPVKFVAMGSSSTIVTFLFRVKGARGGGLGVLGVRVRMKATFTTRNSHFGAVRVRGCP